MLREIADGVLVRQSVFCESNAVVLLDADGAVLVDPGVDGADLDELAEDLATLGAAVTAGFATHPHWDHVLWHERFGVDVPRYAAAACVDAVRERISSMRDMTARFAPGAPLDLVGGVTALPVDSTELPSGGRRVRFVEHRAHAPGHAALLVEGSGVVVAAIPGHGRVARGPEIHERIETDRAYVHALLDGVDPADPRVGPTATYGRDWLPEAHERNRGLAAR